MSVERKHPDARITALEEGGGSATVVFKSQDGATDRITADMQDSERIGIVLDV